MSSDLSAHGFLIVSGDFVRTGGMDLCNYHLARYLAAQGAEVHLVAHRVASELLASPNVRFHRVPRPFGIHLLGERLLRARARWLAASAAMAGAHLVVNGGNCPLPATNWVHYVHAADQPIDGLNFLRRWKNRFAHRLFVREERKALRRAKVIIANSRRTRDDLVHYHQLDAARIRVIYHGTAPETFYPVDTEERQAGRRALGLPEDKYLFLFVGGLGDRRKGFDTLFETWRALGVETLADAALIVVGKGAELPLWQRRAAELPAGASMRFLGFRQDVPAILRACDAFVTPARYESFGLAALEAVCSGLPAIVGSQAGVAERLPSTLTPLLLNDPASVSELTAKLRMLNSRREEFRAAAVEASEELRGYTWDNMARSISAIVQQAEPLSPPGL